MIIKQSLLTLAVALATASGAAQAAQSYCVFDPAGATGQAFNLAKDYVLEAKKWGADLVAKPYTDERVAAEDFKAGQCDAVAITGLRGRQFSPFVGSIDAIGGVPSMKHLNMIIHVLSDPKAAKDMVNGQYEVAGIIPLGGAYIFVRDRSINSVEKAAGKKIAVLDYDKSQAKMAQQMGVQPVSSDILTIGPKFNNGQVDIIAAPAIAYKPFELYKGLGTTGAVYHFPLIEMTGDIIIRPEKFPAGFGQKSRTWIASQTARGEALVSAAEATIPAKYWMDLSPTDSARYVQMMRVGRISLMKDGTYDARMMHFLKKIRCTITPGDAECSNNDE